MTAHQFQAQLRRIADRYLAACLEFRCDLRAAFEAAEQDAAREPELFRSIARGEEERIARLLELQERVDGE